MQRMPYLAVVIFALLLPQQHEKLPLPHHLHELNAGQQQLRQFHLPEGELSQIGTLVRIKECSGKSDVAALRAEQLDLSGNGKVELAVQGADDCMCGATGNCAFWIMRKSSHGYEVLLDTDLTQTFSVEDTRSHGYKDLFTASSGAVTQDIRRYRFDGHKYKLSDCILATFPTGDDPKQTKPEFERQTDCVDQSE